MLAQGRELPELTQFRVLSRIGAGASGTVYRAHDHRQDRIVAVKVLHEATPQALRALHAEFDTLANLSHPNVVRLLEVHEELGYAYVVMELVEGVDFVRYMRPQPGSFHEDRLRKALVQCVVGLDQLHGLGKVHRDVKPSNVRVTSEGRVVILDFGLLVDVHTGLSAEASDALQAGTAAYMAPEQAVGDPVAPATDLYAVGVMLYQALTGDLPFHGSAHDIRVAKVSTAAPDPRARGLAMPDDLARLCVELLAMQPQDRPDARQVLTQLGAIDQIRERGRRNSLPPPHRIPFVGRASELASLEMLATRPKHVTEALHLVGGRGVGKTALMREAARRLSARPNVLWLESTASSAQRAPYEGFQGIIEGLSTHLVRAGVPQELLIDGAETLHELFPQLRRVGGIPHRLGPPSVPDRLERRWRALNALKHMLSCLARDRNVVVWIDDWDHADLDTVRVAERLFRGRGSPPVLVVLASAPGDVALPLAERQVMVLGPLTARESADMLTGMTRGDESDDGERERILAVSQGHPLHLSELLRLSREARLSERALPGALEETLSARVAMLRGAPLHMLELLALIDTPLSAELAQVAMSVSAQETSRAAAELARAGYILYEDATHGMLVLSHSVIAQTVRAFMDPERTMTLHRHIADALSGADLLLLPVLTRHAMAADRPELAADAAFRVSRAAAEVLAMDRAAAFHSLAAELTQQKDQLVQYQSARALAEALAEAGRSVEAAYAYQLAYQTSNAANALDLHRRSAELFVHSGHMEEAGLSCIRDALSTVGETLPETGRGALWSLFRHRAMLSMFGLGFEERTVQQVSARDLTRIDVLWSVGATLGMVDHIRGADFQARGLRYALRAGERTRVARALLLEAAFSAATEPAPRPRAQELLARAESLGQRKDPYFEGLVCFAKGMFEWSRAAHAEYLPLSLRAEELLRTHCSDVHWEVTSAQQLTVTALMWLGRYRELDERVQRYQQEALERGSRHVHASLELFGGYMRLLSLDEPKHARGRIKDAIGLFSRDRFLLQHAGEAMALACIDQYEQRPLDEQRIVEARAGAQASHLLRTIVGRYVILNSEARLCVELAQRAPSELKPQAARLVRIARAMRGLGLSTGSGESDLWLAHARALQGRMDEVPKLLEQAELATLEQTPMVGLSVRYRRGRLIKGDEGKALIQDVTRRLKAEGVRNAPRIVNAFVPAIADTERG